MKKLNNTELRVIEAGKNTYEVGPFTITVTSGTGSFVFDWDLNWALGTFDFAKFTATKLSDKFTVFNLTEINDWKYDWVVMMQNGSFKLSEAYKSVFGAIEG